MPPSPVDSSGHAAVSAEVRPLAEAQSLPLPSTADAVVVGGGSVGASIAYHLARLGAGRVVLLERAGLASGSTGSAAGMITQQLGDELHLRLARESVAFFRALADSGEFGLQFHQVGFLRLLFTPAELATARDHQALWQRVGLDAALLSVAEAEALLPGLATDDLLGATYCASDGYTDPYLATHAIAALAGRAGALIYTDTPVTAVRLAEGRVTGVATPRGEIAAPVVVDAAGPWAAEIAALAGLDLPVRPYRRQLWFTGPFAAVRPDAPVLLDAHHDFYFRREGRGVAMCLGNPGEPLGYGDRPDWSFAERVAEYAVRRFPAFERADLATALAAPRDISPDHEPVLGPLPGVGGFFAAAGHSGHGFMLAPATGRAMAELVLFGRSDPDLSPLGIGRFAGRRADEQDYLPSGV